MAEPVEDYKGVEDCLGTKYHDKMRKAEVDIGGEEETTEELMRPQTGKDIDA